MLSLVALLAAASLSEQVDALVRKMLQSAPLAGVSVYVAKRGEPPIARSYGFDDVELQARATPDSLYRIGSLTKQFTAAAILLLAEEGRVALGDDVTRYVPGAPVHGKKITLWHLLTHTSGLANCTSRPDVRKLGRASFKPEEIVALVKDLPLDFPPGERFAYSNTNYILLGMVIEKAAGVPYAEFIEQRLAPRAGLSHTVYCDNERILPHRAAGYTEARGKLANADFIDMTFPFAAGGLCSTVGDLAAWTRALESGKVVAATSYEKMTTEARTEAGGPTHYGLGLSLTNLEGHQWSGHSGGINGFASSQLRFAVEDILVVVLANSETAPADQLAASLARAALGLPEVQLADLPVPAEELARVEGRYKAGGSELILSGRSGRLYLRAAGAGEDEAARLQYQGGGDYFFAQGGAHLRFLPKDGKAHAMQMGDGKDRWSPEAPRVP